MKLLGGSGESYCRIFGYSASLAWKIVALVYQLRRKSQQKKWIIRCLLKARLDLDQIISSTGGVSV
jgi:hypothetical protein